MDFMNPVIPVVCETSESVEGADKNSHIVAVAVEVGCLLA